MDACTDKSDSVQIVGLRSASLIARTFAKSHPDLILTPFYNFSKKGNWRFRLCSVHFIKSFFFAIAGTTEAEERGIRIGTTVFQKN